MNVFCMYLELASTACMRCGDTWIMCGSHNTRPTCGIRPKYILIHDQIHVSVRGVSSPNWGGITTIPGFSPDHLITLHKVPAFHEGCGHLHRRWVLTTPLVPHAARARRAVPRPPPARHRPPPRRSPPARPQLRTIFTRQCFGVRWVCPVTGSPPQCPAISSQCPNLQAHSISPLVASPRHCTRDDRE